MMTNNQILFLQLIKVGLWGDKECDSLVEIVKQGGFDWEKVMELASQQASIGIVTDALVKLPAEMRPSKALYLNAVAMTGDIEKLNKKMNDFAPVLLDKLKGKGVEALLLKGQGVALCYPNPLHRMSGDIDLLIYYPEQFMKAGELMKRIATSYDWDGESQHAEFEAMGFVIELHGRYGFSINKKVTELLSYWNYERILSFDELRHRTVNGLILPEPQFDAIFIFAHMLNHFMTGGVGLRQIADWMMFLNTYYDDIDMKELKYDLDLLGLNKFWKTFGAMVVSLLGFPQDKMPFYDKRYEKKAGTLIKAIFKTGNFGTLQKEKQLSNDTNRWLKKVHTAFGQLPVYWRAGRLFPLEAIYCFFKYSKEQLTGR